MDVIAFNKIEHDVIQKPVPTFWHHALDHDVVSSKRADDMNVMAFNKIEHDVIQKPVPTFWHHALGDAPALNRPTFGSSLRAAMLCKKAAAHAAAFERQAGTLT